MSNRSTCKKKKRQGRPALDKDKMKVQWFGSREHYIITTSLQDLGKTIDSVVRITHFELIEISSR